MKTQNFLKQRIRISGPQPATTKQMNRIIGIKKIINILIIMWKIN